MFIQAPNAASPQDPGDSVARDLVLTWLRTFVGRPHDGLGRSGDVCPYVSTALDVGAITVLIARGRPSRAEVEVAASEVRRMFLASPLQHPEFESCARSCLHFQT
jgi:hypothetical protein